MADSNPKNACKAYQFLFVLYPDSQADVISYVQSNFPCAWAFHDKDTYSEEDLKDYSKDHGGNCPTWNVGDSKSPHYHFVVKFKNQRYASGVAKELRKVPSVKRLNDAAIKRCYNLYKSYVYLWHELNPEKAQYDPNIVGLHDFEPPEKNEGVSEEEQVETLFDMPKCQSVKQMARWAYDNGCWSSFRKNYVLWKDIQKEMHGGLDGES